MSERQRGTTPERPYGVGLPDVLELGREAALDPGHRRTACAATPGSSCVTPAGADWLASACVLPSSVHALWLHRPSAPSVLPCGTAFDVVSAAPLPGRLILERLWSCGPGSGPAAVHRGRVLLFAAPGTAQRLTALLDWGEWRQPPACAENETEETFPSHLARPPRPSNPPRPPHVSLASPTGPLLCLGPGDSVTIPALHHGHPEAGPAPFSGVRDEPAPSSRLSRWLVAPDVRHPWLPGPEALLRACVRLGRDRPDGRSARPRTPVPAGRGLMTGRERISGTADRDAKVYDVTRRR